MPNQRPQNDGPQKDVMDLLEAWAEDYNTAARPAVRLETGGEAGGAQLRLRYQRPDGELSILHMVAAERDGRPVILARRFDGPHPDAVVEAGLWASSALGRRG